MKKTILQSLFILGLVVIFSQDASAATISASRGAGGVPCVAPCSIFFEDIDGTIDSTTSGEVKPFHDYHYEWDFGDPTSGNWGTNGKSKNIANGATAAHIYEEAGDYTVTLTVHDSATKNQIGTDQVTVNITDPDVIFSDTKTTCVSNTAQNDFSGCPTGANQIVTDDLQTVTGYADAGERLLLHRGSSWGLSSQWSLPNNAGPVQIGAYGICSNPNSQGICNNNPVLSLTAADVNTILMNGKQNWVVSDISLQGYSLSGRFIIAGNTSQNNLYYRLKAEDYQQAFFFQSTRTGDTESEKLKYNTLAECYTPYNTASYSLWAAGENFAVLGNEFLGGGSHTIRIYQGYKLLLSNNIVSGGNGPSYTVGLALKLHSPCEIGYACMAKVGTFAQTGAGGVENRTQFVVISDNVFGGSAPYTISVAPQNAEYDERISDLVLERNKVLANYGEPPHGVMTGYYLSGSYFTVRNNIVDVTGGSQYINAIVIGQQGTVPVPTGNNVYNNTIYRSDTIENSSSYPLSGIRIGYAADVKIKNNIVSFPNWPANHTLIKNNWGESIVDESNNVLTDAPHFTNPDSAAPLSRDFSLTNSSAAAIDQGAPVPVYDDFTGTQRTNTFDIGAYEYQTLYRSDVDNSGSTSTADALLTLRNSLGLDMSATAWQASEATGDVNCDGSSNSTDALLILRYSLGLGMSETGWCEVVND